MEQYQDPGQDEAPPPSFEPIHVDLGYGHTAEFPPNTNPDEISKALKGWEPSQLDKEVWDRAQKGTKGLDGGPLTSEELASRPLLRKSYEDEIAKSWGLLAELGHGATLGMADKVVTAGHALARGQSYEEAKQPIDASREAWEGQNPALATGATLLSSVYPTTRLMSGIDAGTNALLHSAPGAAKFVAGESGGALRIPSLLTAGAKQGAEAGLLQSQLNPDQGIGEQILGGAITGTALAPARPIYSWLVARGIDPRVAQTAEDSSKLGVDLTPKQIQFGPRAVSPGKGVEQLGQYNRALSKTIGGDFDGFTQGNFSTASDKLSQRFDNVVPKLFLEPGDPALHSDLADLETHARSSLVDPSAVSAVDKSMKIVRGLLHDAFMRPGVGSAPTGVVSGNQFQDLTKKSGLIDNLMQDPKTRYYGVKLRSILEDSLERSSMPEDVQEFRQARQQWKNMVALEPLVDKTSPTGLIDPTQVQAATARAYKEYSWGGAPEDLTTLGKAGMFLPKPTIQGEAKQKMTVGHGGLIGAGVGGLAVAGGYAGEKLLPLLSEHPFYAAGGAAALLGLVGGKKVSNMMSENAAYKQHVIDRVLHPERYGSPSNALVAGANAALPRSDNPLLSLQPTEEPNGLSLGR